MLELISVHTPKCAGTSFSNALLEAYSPERVLLDYADRPADPGSPMNIDPEGFFARSDEALRAANERSVVHGHFHLRKYAGAPSACPRVTFLREPVDRLISHYFYWKSHPPEGHSVHSYVVRNALTIERMARLPTVRWLYTGVFFKGVELEMLDFIGFHEQMPRDLERLGGMLGRSLPLLRLNTMDTGANVDDAATIRADTRLMAFLRESLADDIAFYDRARARWA